MARKNFFVVTADHSGMPLALRLQDEGHSVVLLMVRPELADGRKVTPRTPEEAKRFRERTEYLKKNGSGLVRRKWIDEALPSLLKLDKKNTYIIFDQIYGWQYGEELRRRGFKVFGGTKLGYELETNRSKTLQLFRKLGLDIPFMKKFGPNSADEGIRFLKQAKDMLFVLKSDNPKVYTQVAHDSNEELIQKIEMERDEINRDGFILQQKVEGIEAAVETWYCNGKPILANVDLEAKRKYNEMSEVQVGCSFNLLWAIPVDHPLRLKANGPFDEFAAKNIGTGLLDLSFIYDHREGKLYALECCGVRPAYNAFYALLSLLTVPVGDFLAAFLDGEFKKDVSASHFLPHFAASLRVFNDEKTPDQPVSFPQEMKPQVWLWDVYKRNGRMLTTGDESVGILTATGENPESALARLREAYFKFHMPTKWARDDFDDEDIPTLPLARYHEMKRLKLI